MNKLIFCFTGNCIEDQHNFDAVGVKSHFTCCNNFEKCNLTPLASKNNVRTAGNTLHPCVIPDHSGRLRRGARVQRSRVGVNFFAPGNFGNSVFKISGK